MSLSKIQSSCHQFSRHVRHDACSQLSVFPTELSPEDRGRSVVLGSSAILVLLCQAAEVQRPVRPEKASFKRWSCRRKTTQTRLIIGRTTLNCINYKSLQTHYHSVFGFCSLDTFSLSPLNSPQISESNPEPGRQSVPGHMQFPALLVPPFWQARVRAFRFRGALANIVSLTLFIMQDYCERLRTRRFHQIGTRNEFS